MKKEKGEDPSFSEFYFRTHRKRDQSWVGGVAQSAYEKFEQKKQEISSQNTFVSGEDEVNSQPNMPPDMDIWVDTVGKKKMRVFGLGSLSKSLISSSNQSTSANTREVDDLRSQVHALNASLQRQAQEKEQMMQQLQRQDQEMKETNQKLSSLMQHLGFTGSSSHPPQANNEKFTNEHEDGNQKLTNEDEDDNNEFEEDDNNYFEDHYNYNEYEDLN
ncbi:hypothetical protein QL285_076695 [Trifolium repens]|nr:hypothetical protein QL285_076695 [Trifolium repens]